jgi:NurA-like 5'-3' nuclease
MWRLSDKLLEEFSDKLDETYRAVELAAEEAMENWKWIEMPEPKKCRAYGVDGSRGIERLSGLIVYAVSGVAVGDEIIELHDVTTLKPYKHVDERIRLHMELMELRIASMAGDADLLLLDGTLSGAVIRPPVYVREFDEKKGIYKTLAESYDLNTLIDDFIDTLDAWWYELERDMKAGEVRRNTLLTRSEYFDGIEDGCKKGMGDKDNLMILFEYLEYLHALNRLLERKNVVFVAKSFYTNEVAKTGITDAPVVDLLAVKQFGEEKAGYLPFKYREVDKRLLPNLARKFRNVGNAIEKLSAAFVRFSDYGSVYLVESSSEVDEDLISMLVSFEADGYLLPLIHAHNYAEIKRRELKMMILNLLTAVAKPEHRFLLKKGRDVLES